MKAGQGDDTYVVDNARDVVVDTWGRDTVLASVNYILGANVEILVLVGAVRLGTGNSSANLIRGNDADNRLDGGAGWDTLAGGNGDDLYIVDSSRDRVMEAATGGVDSVLSSASFILPDHVENLTLTGSAAVSGTGNADDNLLVGNSAANRLDGGGGADTLRGGLGDDVYVVDGSDVVLEAEAGGSGGAGRDRMDGGAGADTYLVDDAGDVASESIEDTARDQVLASVSYTLREGVDDLTLLGEASVGIGNDLGNRIEGNARNNRLDGGAGNDTLLGGDGNDTLVGGALFDELRGGAGSDRFVYGSVADSDVASADSIADFQPGADRIDLSHLDGNTTVGGRQALEFIGELPSGTGGSTGQMGYEKLPDGVLLFANVNASAAADFVLRLPGVSALDPGDFIL